MKSSSMRTVLWAVVVFGSVGMLPAEAAAVCGDFVVDMGEDCDDGATPGTCCAPDCTYRAEGTACDDFDECTASSACDAAGSCTSEDVCDDGDPCTMDHCGMAGCEAWPAPSLDCQTGERSVLVVKDVEGSFDKRSIRWKLTRGATLLLSDIGDPVTATSYKLCVFRDAADVDDLLAAALVLGPSAAWTVENPKGATYKDPSGAADGVTGARLATGEAGRSKVSLTAKGENLPAIEHFDSTALFEPGTGATVQLHNLENGKCWAADFDAFRKNTATVAKAGLP